MRIMKRMRISLASIAVLMLSTIFVMAQDVQKPLRLGIGLMGASYVGDLNTGDDPVLRFHPGLNFSLQFVSEKLISPQLNTGFGRIVGQDRNLESVDGVDPNTFVETPFFYADFRLKARFMRESWFVPYLSAGVGLFGYTPKDQDGNNLLDNLATRIEGETYGSLTAGFPLSMGSEFHMSSILAMGVEYTFRPTTSDYLDNISQLGLRDGNDKLHQLAISILITIDPNSSGSSGIRGKDRR